MTGPDLIMVLAWCGAIFGPLICFIAIRRLFVSRRFRMGWGLATFSLLFWVLGVWAFLVEPATLTVRHVTVESAEWTGAPLRIGIISDTHVAAPHTDPARVERLVRRMNGERPDVVLLLGDYVGGHLPERQRPPAERREILAGIEAFEALDSPLGTWGVLGNHDSWFDDATVAAALETAGIPVMDNRARRIDRDTGAFWIAGLADMHATDQPPRVGATLRQVTDEAPVVLMTHWPDPFAEVPDRVALTLAGHTHCGQVVLPVVGRLVHASRLSERWPCGLYDEGGRKLFVTGGVGVSILPVRFRAPPEIVILTLQAPAG
jgi:uncharacterized protein